MVRTQLNIVRITIFFAFLCQPRFIFAQAPSLPPGEELLGTPSIRAYYPKEYGLDGQTWSITQDQRGLIYIGGFGKIIEYDGAVFRIIDSPESLIYSLHTGDNGKVYVGLNNDIGVLESSDSGTLQYVSLLDNYPDLKGFGYVWDIESTSDGIYFIADKRIILLEGKTPRLLKKQADTTYRATYKIKDRLFLADRSGVFYVIENKRLRVLPGSASFEMKSTSAFVPLPDEKMLIITDGSGCFVYDLRALDPTWSKKLAPHEIVKALPTQVEDFLKKYRMTRAVRLTSNLIAISSQSGGIVIIDNQGFVRKVITGNDGLSGDAIQKLFVDRDKNLWAVTMNGFSMIEVLSPLSSFGRHNNLKTGVISLLPMQDRLLVGTFSGILELTGKTKEFDLEQIEQFQPIQGTRTQAFVLFKKDSHLFAGVNRDFGMIKDHRIEFFDHIKLKGITFSHGFSKRFSDYVFLGLYLEGLVALKIKTTGQRPTVELYSDGSFKEIHEHIARIVSDPHGDLWLSTVYKGLIKIKFNDSSDVTDFSVQRYGLKDGLPSLEENLISDINGELIVATHKGFYKAVCTKELNAMGKECTFVPETSFGALLQGTRLSDIIKMHDDKYLVYAANGVSLVETAADGSFRLNQAPFTKIEDKPSGIFYDKINNNIWLSTNSNLFLYNPRVKKDYNKKPDVLIRKFTAGKKVVFGGARSEARTQPRTVLPFEDNSLNFDYASPFYEQGIRNRYSFLLEGFENQWSDWNYNYSKEYTNLHEGAYCFQVKARNTYGVISDPDSICFFISAPWYRTWGAYLLFLSIGAALVFGIYRSYLGVRRKLEKIIRDRTIRIQQQKEQLKAANLELENNIKKLSETQELLRETSRQAGMAEVTSSLLHNVCNVLNSLTVSVELNSERLHESRVDRLSDAMTMFEENKTHYVTSDPTGHKLLDYINRLTEMLVTEKKELLKEFKQITDHVRHIRTIVTSPQIRGKPESQLEEIQIEDIVDIACIICSLVPNHRAFEVQKNYAELPPMILDKHGVLQIVVNLLNNAKQAFKGVKCDQRIINISTIAKGNDRFELRIEDNGIGIESDTMENLFSFGFTTKKDGHGFGLHHSFNLATQMNGTLTCNSKGRNCGAMFVLELALQTKY